MLSINKSESELINEICSAKMPPPIFPLILRQGKPALLCSLDEPTIRAFLKYLWDFTKFPTKCWIFPARTLRQSERMTLYRRLVNRTYENCGYAFILAKSEDLHKNDESGICSCSSLYMEYNKIGTVVTLKDKKSQEVIARIPVSNLTYDCKIRSSVKEEDGAPGNRFRCNEPDTSRRTDVLTAVSLIPSIALRTFQSPTPTVHIPAALTPAAQTPSKACTHSADPDVPKTPSKRKHEEDSNIVLNAKKPCASVRPMGGASSCTGGPSHWLCAPEHSEDCEVINLIEDEPVNDLQEVPQSISTKTEGSPNDSNASDHDDSIEIHEEVCEIINLIDDDAVNDLQEVPQSISTQTEGIPNPNNKTTHEVLIEIHDEDSEHQLIENNYATEKNLAVTENVSFRAGDVPNLNGTTVEEPKAGARDEDSDVELIELDATETTEIYSEDSSHQLIENNYGTEKKQTVTENVSNHAGDVPNLNGTITEQTIAEAHDEDSDVELIENDALETTEIHSEDSDIELIEIVVATDNRKRMLGSASAQAETVEQPAKLEPKKIDSEASKKEAGNGEPSTLNDCPKGGVADLDRQPSVVCGNSGSGHEVPKEDSDVIILENVTSVINLYGRNGASISKVQDNSILNRNDDQDSDIELIEEPSDNQQKASQIVSRQEKAIVGNNQRMTHEPSEDIQVDSDIELIESSDAAEIPKKQPQSSSRQAEAVLANHQTLAQEPSGDIEVDSDIELIENNDADEIENPMKRTQRLSRQPEAISANNQTTEQENSRDTPVLAVNGNSSPIISGSEFKVENPNVIILDPEIEVSKAESESDTNKGKVHLDVIIIDSDSEDSEKDDRQSCTNTRLIEPEETLPNNNTPGHSSQTVFDARDSEKKDVRCYTNKRLIKPKEVHQNGNMEAHSSKTIVEPRNSEKNNTPSCTKWKHKRLLLPKDSQPDKCMQAHSSKTVFEPRQDGDSEESFEGPDLDYINIMSKKPEAVNSVIGVGAKYNGWDENLSIAWSRSDRPSVDDVIEELNRSDVCEHDVIRGVNAICPRCHHANYPLNESTNLSVYDKNKKAGFLNNFGLSEHLDLPDGRVMQSVGAMYKSYIYNRFPFTMIPCFVERGLVDNLTLIPGEPGQNMDLGEYIPEDERIQEKPKNARHTRNTVSRMMSVLNNARDYKFPKRTFRTRPPVPRPRVRRLHKAQPPFLRAAPSGCLGQVYTSQAGPSHARTSEPLAQGEVQQRVADPHFSRAAPRAIILQMNTARYGRNISEQQRLQLRAECRVIVRKLPYRYNIL